jgi:hypothetical protein
LHLFLLSRFQTHSICFFLFCFIFQSIFSCFGQGRQASWRDFLYHVNLKAVLGEREYFSETYNLIFPYRTTGYQKNMHCKKFEKRGKKGGLYFPSLKKIMGIKFKCRKTGLLIYPSYLTVANRFTSLFHDITYLATYYLLRVLHITAIFSISICV